MKCLFAIDVIAAVYGANSARFENGPARSLSELRSATHRADQLTPMLRLGLSPLRESKSEAVRTPHFQPAAMRRADCPQEDGRAIVTP